MKKITIEDDVYKQKCIIELDSDSNIIDVIDAMKGLLIVSGYSYELINQYFKDE